jgi:hypothetical protein
MPPFFRVELGNAGVGFRGGIVYQNVQLAPELQSRCHHGFYVFIAGYITRENEYGTLR